MKKFNSDRAFNNLQEISFPRLGGTVEEKKAAAIIKKEIKKEGLTPNEDIFKVMTYNHGKGELQILKPFKKKYEAVPMGLAPNTPKAGIKAPLKYLTMYDDISLKEAKNKIVLLYKGLDKKLYEKLINIGVKGIISITDNKLFIHRTLSDLFIKSYGAVPAVTIDYDSALEIARREAKQCVLKSSQRNYSGNSRNIWVKIPGTEYKDEIIFVCSHYDSVIHSPGVQDNAAGSVSNLELLRYFAKNRPLRSMVFAWFGSEELGLYGSFNFVKKHKAMLKKIKLLINLDLGGSILGVNSMITCGSKSLKNYLESMTKEKGLPVLHRSGAYSSDNIPFNEKKISSVAIARYGGSYGHSHRDDMKLSAPGYLSITGDFALEFTERIVNAIELPFDLDVEKSDMKEIYDYIERRTPKWKRPVLN